MIGAMIKRGATGSVTVPKFQPKAGITKTAALDTLDDVLRSVEQTDQPGVGMADQGLMSQVMPQVMAQTADALDPALKAVTTSRKETAAEAVSLEQLAADAARGVQQVEVEPTPEISPEVESYLQKVEDHTEMAPKEIVIADGTQTSPVDHQYPSQPVVVLPITQEEEKEGAKKSPKFSIRWLVEWSRRLMKMFIGKIIYRPVEGSTA